MAESTAMNNQDKVNDLLKAHVQAQKEAIRTLEGKAMHNLTIVNIIAGIVGALNLPIGADEGRLKQIVGNQSIAYLSATILSIILVALCVFVATLSIRTLWVRRLRTHPMQPTKQNAKDWSASDPLYFSGLIQESYVDIYRHNSHIVDNKGSMVSWSHKAIVLIIALILTGTVLIAIEPLLPVLQAFFTPA